MADELSELVIGIDTGDVDNLAAEVGKFSASVKDFAANTASAAKGTAKGAASGAAGAAGAASSSPATAAAASSAAIKGQVSAGVAATQTFAGSVKSRLAQEWDAFRNNLSGDKAGTVWERVAGIPSGQTGRAGRAGVNIAKGLGGPELAALVGKITVGVGIAVAVTAGLIHTFKRLNASVTESIKALAQFSTAATRAMVESQVNDLRRQMVRAQRAGRSLEIANRMNEIRKDLLAPLMDNLVIMKSMLAAVMNIVVILSPVLLLINSVMIMVQAVLVIITNIFSAIAGLVQAFFRLIPGFKGSKLDGLLEMLTKVDESAEKIFRQLVKMEEEQGVGAVNRLMVSSLEQIAGGIPMMPVAPEHQRLPNRPDPIRRTR